MDNSGSPGLGNSPDAAAETDAATLADEGRAQAATLAATLAGGDSMGATGPEPGPDPDAVTLAGDSATPPRSGEGAASTRRFVAPAVPGYEILSELGRGTMGVVYLGRQVLLNRPCALKMILAGQHAGAELLLRFLAEAEVVARLQHTCVVQIHHIGEAGGLPYFELEYVPGGSLDKILDGTPWPASRAARLVEQLALAMVEAHKLGIVHRDLKPGNVLLAADGTPKITDFGLAKLLNAESGLTRTESILGSPSYMAPEQAEGHAREVGPTADIYALGAILYELLTGRPPFKGASVLETLEQVKRSEPVAPGRLVPGLPRDLETIALKCLQKEPAKRYASSEALAEDLRRFLAGEPIRARRIGFVERTYRWCRRNPSLAASVGLAAAALVAVTVLSSALALAQGRALAEIRTEQRRTQEALSQARAQSAKLAAERGIALAEQRDAGRGLLWLAHALELDPGDASGLHEAVRRNLTRAAREQLATPRAVLRPEGPAARGDAAEILAFRPDGRLVAVGHGRGAVRLWDPVAAKPVGPPLGPTAPHSRVTALRFHPDGKALLVGLVITTDPKTRAVRHELQTWDVAAGKPLREPLPLPGRVEAISADGRLVAAVEEAPDSLACTARLHYAATGSPVSPRMPHDRPISSAAFSPDGQTLLTGDAPPDESGLARARLWGVADGKLIWQSARHPDWHIYTVAFSPDGRYVATAAKDRNVRLFEAASGEPVGSPMENADQVNALAFSPDGRTLAAGTAMVTGGRHGRAEVRLWDRETGRPIGPDIPHDDGIAALAFAPDGATLLTADVDGTTQIWAAPEGPPVGRVLGTEADDALALTRDGRTLLAGGYGGEVRQCDPATGRPNGPALKAGKYIWRIAVSPDGRIVAAGTGLPASTNQSSPGFGEVRLWVRASGRPIGGPLAHRTDRVKGVAFTADGKTLVTADRRTLRLWDPATGRNLGRDFEVSDRGITALAAAPSGTRVLVADGPGRARIWDVATRQPVSAPIAAHREVILALAFSPDGQSFATASLDKTARVWATATGRPRGPSLEHRSLVRALAFSPDGRVVATGSSDGAVGLWDAATGTTLGTPLAPGPEVSALAFPDDQTLAVATFKETSLWDVPAPAAGDPARITLWAEAITGRSLDSQDAVTALGLDAWLGRRSALAAQGGTPRSVVSTPGREARRRLALAQAAERARDWFAGLWHLDRLSASRPADAELILLRAHALARAGRADDAASEFAQALGRTEDPKALHDLGEEMLRLGRKDEALAAFARALKYADESNLLWDLGDHFARLGRWAESAEVYAKLSSAGRPNPNVVHRRAMVCLKAGDLDGYRAGCAAMLGAFGATRDPDLANSIAWPCALGPDAVPDLAAIVRLAEVAVATAPAIGEPRHQVLNTLGAALYRAGKAEEALVQLEEGIKADGNADIPQDWAFLALVHDRLGHQDQARDLLDKLAAWKPQGAADTFWNDLEIELLREQAEAIRRPAHDDPKP